MSHTTQHTARRTLGSLATTALLIGALVATPTLTGTTNVGGGPAHADETAAPTQAAGVAESTATYGALKGIITDADTGLPAAGVTVQWSGGGKLAKTVTTEDGSYRLGGLPARNGWLYLNRQCCDSMAGGYGNPDRANYLPAERMAVRVNAGVNTTYSTSLEAGAVIEGQLLDGRGRPYEKGSTYISILDTEVEDWYANERYLTGPSFELAADGRYRAAGVIPGTVHLEISLRSGGSQIVQSATATKGGLTTLNIRNSLLFNGGTEWEESTIKQPTVNGSASVGRTLRAKIGDFFPKPSHIKYQWFRGSKAIKGATKRTYKLTTKDKGARMQVRVTGSRLHFVTEPRRSQYSVKVKG